MIRMPAKYDKIKDLKLITPDDLITVELNARACSFTECLDLIFLQEDEIPESDMNYLTRAWRKGRVAGIADASERMFKSFGSPRGGSVALDYLKSLGDAFKVEASPTGHSNGGFTFNVKLDDQVVGRQRGS